MNGRLCKTVKLPEPRNSSSVQNLNKSLLGVPGSGNLQHTHKKQNNPTAFIDKRAAPLPNLLIDVDCDRYVEVDLAYAKLELELPLVKKGRKAGSSLSYPEIIVATNDCRRTVYGRLDTNVC
jgi:hypothetical protein